jgi:hypothetical protein
MENVARKLIARTGLKEIIRTTCGDNTPWENILSTENFKITGIPNPLEAPYKIPAKIARQNFFSAPRKNLKYFKNPNFCINIFPQFIFFLGGLLVGPQLRAIVVQKFSIAIIKFYAELWPCLMIY